MVSFSPFGVKCHGPAGRVEVHLDRMPAEGRTRARLPGDFVKGYGHRAEVTSVAISPDGHQVLSGSADGTILLGEIETGRLLRRFVGHKGLVGSLAFSPNARLVLSGGEDGTVQLWDVPTEEILGRFTGHAGEVRSVTSCLGYYGSEVSGLDNPLHTTDQVGRRSVCFLYGWGQARDGPSTFRSSRTKQEILAHRRRPDVRDERRLDRRRHLPDDGAGG
ncbi:MAG: WD40 repeat domain-containing protein [Isosphaeraceae bacterium]